MAGHGGAGAHRTPATDRGRDRLSVVRRGQLPVVEEVSAGGLVVLGRGHDASAALIGRLDRRGRMLWSLPKGHLEIGESAEATAVREVAEETGIEGSILESLGTIDFWFVADGSRIHKTVHHFLLVAVGGELSDADGEVSAVDWVPLGQLATRLAHADERELVSDLQHLRLAIA